MITFATMLCSLVLLAAQEPPPPVPPPPTTQVPLDANLRSTLDLLGIVHTENPTNGVFSVNWNYTNTKRHQRVYVASFTEPLNPADPASPLVRRIWSHGHNFPTDAPVTLEQLTSLMTRSNTRRFGSWELVKESNGTMTAVYCLKVPGELSPTSLKWCLTVAGWEADEVDKELSDGQDLM